MGVGYETYRGYLALLVEKLKAAMGEGGLLACCLFGSVARGEARPGSDLDLLVIHGEECRKPLDAFLEVLRALEVSGEHRALVTAGYRPDPYPVFLSAQDL